MPTPNDQTGVGLDGTHKQPTDKYDAEHGKYQQNVPEGTHVPNASPAAPDPSPFRVGTTK